MNGFPFSIVDVARLCGLHPTGDGGNSEYINCPFCGRKKKMNLNYERGQYNCPACGHGGSMLKLYAELRGGNFPTNAIIVEEIKKELGLGFSSPQKTFFNEDTQNNNQIDFDKLKHIDKAYRALLSKLSLAEIHKRKLLDRGLDEDDIARFSFKSVPVFGYKSICKQLRNDGIYLDGVGGFYIDEGEWTININPKTTGYIVPTYDYFGFIEGLQIRLDRPFGKTKYLWISSDGLPSGTGVTAAPFFIKGKNRPETLFITEGAFKAIIPNKIFSYTILAVPGVNNIKELIKLVPYFNYKNIKIAFDADYRVNENVAKAKERLMEILFKKGFNVSFVDWDPSNKGFDDFACAWLRQRTDSNK